MGRSKPTLINSIKFDALFEQALQDWAQHIDIDKPIHDESFDIHEKATKRYIGKREAILMVSLHWKMYNALGKESREGRLPFLKNTKAEVKRNLEEALWWSINEFKKDLQTDIDHFEEDLEWQSKNLYTKKKKIWSLWTVGLAKAYLDANKEEQDNPTTK